MLADYVQKQTTRGYRTRTISRGITVKPAKRMPFFDPDTGGMVIAAMAFLTIVSIGTLGVVMVLIHFVFGR